MPKTVRIIPEIKNKSLCRIFNNNGDKGIGFFCIIPLNEYKLIKVIITDISILGETDLEKDIMIKIKF